MPARVAWWLNLDGERELEHGDSYNRAPAVAERVLQLTEHLRGSLIRDGDVVLSDDAASPPDALGRPWCVTTRAVAALRRLGLRVDDLPDVAVVRQANHRAFNAQLGQALPHARFVAERAELNAVLSERSGSWLLKRPFSFGGAGRRRLMTSTPDAADDRWIDASLARDGLQAEPWVERLGDYALHGFVRQGSFALGRPCLQECSPTGHWQRSAPANDLSTGERNALLSEGERTALALQQLGYRGPFNIDAMRYRLAGGPAFAPRIEVNARYSMGWATGLPDRPDLLDV